LKVLLVEGVVLPPNNEVPPGPPVATPPNAGAFMPVDGAVVPGACAEKGDEEDPPPPKMFLGVSELPEPVVPNAEGFDWPDEDVC
jgi:hypothetical protein